MRYLVIFLLLFLNYQIIDAQTSNECEEENLSPAAILDRKQAPYESMFADRNYPEFEMAYEAYEHALITTKAMSSGRATPPFNLNWQIEGPYNIGGRINCIAIHPTNSNIMYIGLSDGGIYKTIDKGISWTSIFDNQNKLSIGDIYIDKHNPNVIYAGTGDPNISGYPAIGDGLYRSVNAGATWTYLGLAADKIVSKVEVHPTDSNLIFCSTMGMPFYKTNDRGLYRSTDRGTTWNKILFLSDSTGVIDFEINPSNANIIYASAWTRIRNNRQGLIQGIESAVYKTIDGGLNWTKLGGGLPTSINSRITIEMSKQNPNKLYALVVDTFLDVGGLFKTTDAGITWTNCNIIGLPLPAQGNFGWYFDGIKINPYNDNDIYLLGVNLYRSSDAGDNFSQIDPAWWTYEVHADKHDLVFASTDTVYLATDGGLYRTTNFGITWSDEDRIPNTEFYHIAVNPNVAKQYAGGAQDNGTTWGTSLDTDWPRVFGGDGFNVVFKNGDPDIVYAETQNGGIVASSNGGFSFNDIPVTTGDRTNWDQPFILSPHNSSVMYTGTYQIYKNTIAPSENWSGISSDLTDGVIYGDRFHNISTIAESPFRAGLLYVGTSDGNVWRTDNDGFSWNNISAGLPDRYMTRVVPSKTDSNTIFVCNSGYKDGDNIPHIHVSRNKGATWTDISGDLPPLAINDIELTSLTDSLIFIANDGGVYYTMDYGTNWLRLGNNMPYIWVYDIEVDLPNQRLVAGTFAKSIQSIPIDTIFAQFTSITAVASATDDTICKNESITLNASGGTAYLWTPATGLTCSTCPSTAATPLVSTDYVVRVSVGAAVSYDTIKIVVNPRPAASIITAHRDTLFAASASAYQWYKSGILIPAANQQFYITSVAGNYTVELSNIYGCTTTSSNFSFNGFSSVGIESIYAEDFALFPIAAKQSLKLIFNTTNSTNASIYLYDMNGRKVIESSLDNVLIGRNEHLISIGDISPGVYLFRLNIGDEIKQGKLIVGF